MLNQHFEQRKLAGGEWQRLVAARKTARCEIEREVTERHDLLIGRRRAGRLRGRYTSEHRLNPRDELTRVEGFRQIIVRADLEPDDAIDVVTFGGQHDDW